MKDWTKLKGLISKGFKKVEKLEPNETDVFTIPSMEKEDAKEDSTKDGLIEGFYENGQLEHKGNYKKPTSEFNFLGDKDGPWEYFDEEGNLTKTEKYMNGELVD